MALEKGVNSYVTVEEADAYYADRLGGQTWLALTEDVKSAALISATQHIDEMRWKNSAMNIEQPLAFPRTGTYFDKKIGANLPMSATPKRVLTATMEWALYLYNNNGVLDGQSSVKGLKVGPIELIGMSASSSEASPVATRLLADLQVGSASGGRHWWRAN